MSEKNKSKCKPPQKMFPNLRPVEGEDADNEMAKYAKAIGHPTRVKILRFLSKKNDCMCGEIVDEINVPQSTTSQHLKVLKEAGIIVGTISGVSSCYCIDPNALTRVKVLISSL